MANQFSLGDVVKLKSGGPKMTVNNSYGDGRTLSCVWFVGTEQKEARFSPEALEPAGADD
jgi:uncharacterized protein YodC (DUF2158 family)